jgi:hypothetical protein
MHHDPNTEKSHEFSDPKAILKKVQKTYAITIPVNRRAKRLLRRKLNLPQSAPSKYLHKSTAETAKRRKAVANSRNRTTSSSDKRKTIAGHRTPKKVILRLKNSRIHPTNRMAR